MVEELALRLAQTLQDQGDASEVRHCLERCDEETVQALLQLLEDCFTSACPAQPNAVTAGDLLRVLLSSLPTGLRATKTCLQLIGARKVVGRQAVFCVSEIRQALILELRGRKDLSGHFVFRRPGRPNQQPQQQHEQRPQDTCRMLVDIRELLEDGLLGMVEGLTGKRTPCWDGVNDPQRLSEVTLTLDVVPPLILLAQSLEEQARLKVSRRHRQQQQHTRKGNLGGQQSLGDADEAGSAVTCDLDLDGPSIGEVMTTRVVSLPWPPPLTVALLGVCADMANMFEAASWARVREKVRDNARFLQSNELPGLLRQCLVLAETRTEPEWVGLMRELYQLVPSDAAATTELVLEQCVRQSLAGVQLILHDIQSRLTEQQQAEPRSHENIGPPLSWHDGALLLLLARSLTAWPLSPALVLTKDQHCPLAAQADIDRLLLELIMRLVATDTYRSSGSATSCFSSSSAAAAAAPCSKSNRRGHFGTPLLRERKRRSRHRDEDAQDPRSSLSTQLIERMRHVAWQMLTQDGAVRHQLGQLAVQRGSQLFAMATAWMRHAERVCQDLRKRRVSNQVSSWCLLRPRELRQFCVTLISTIYGEVPEGQGKVLSSLLGSIMEQAHVHQRPKSTRPAPSTSAAPTTAAVAAANSRSPQWLLVQALEAITTDWPFTLRQHSQVFQQLIAQLCTLPAGLACPLMEAVVPLACSCPAFYDALLSVIRKTVTQPDVQGRRLGITALTALLAEHGGLMAMAERSEEVACMFQSLLGLSLPLHLKSALYRSVTRLLGRLHVSEAIPHQCAVGKLRETMGRRLRRVMATPMDVGEAVSLQDEGLLLMPLALYEQYRVKGVTKATARDDLPELLRCVLALSDGDGTLPLYVAKLVLGVEPTTCVKGKARALRACDETGVGRNVARVVVQYFKDGCRMEAPEAMSFSSEFELCDADAVSACDKMHLLLDLAEVLADVLLSHLSTGKCDVESHGLVYAACLELYRVHGMLTDVAEDLGLKEREGLTTLEGREREAPLLCLTGSVYMVQLFMLACRSKMLATNAETLPLTSATATIMGRCQECVERQRRYRYLLWAVEHCVVSCRRALEAERVDKGGTAQAAEHRFVSLKTLLIIVMELYELCADRPLLHAHLGFPTSQDGKCACQASKAPADSKRSARMDICAPQDGACTTLSSAFMRNVDGQFRNIVKKRWAECLSSDVDESVVDVRVALMDLARIVVRCCPVDSLDGDEVFAFVESTSPTTRVSPAAAAEVDADSGGLELEVVYKGLPSFIDSLVGELGQGIVRGVPYRLVQSYVDLLEMLLYRLPAPQHDSKEMRRFQHWRSDLAQAFVATLVRTCVHQSTIVRRFLRLSMLISPVRAAVSLSGGLIKAVITAFHAWVLEQQGPSVSEVVSSEAALKEVEEEAREGSSSTSNSDAERHCSSEEDATIGCTRTPKQHKRDSRAISELDVSSMKFDSAACWQAALAVVLNRWQEILTPSAEASDADDDISESLTSAYSLLMRQMGLLMAPLDFGGHRGKHKVAAALLPVPLKLRLLAALACLLTKCRAAAIKTQSRLKASVKAAAQPPSKPKAAWSPSDDHGLEHRHDERLVLAYVEEGHKLAAPLDAWIMVERSRTKQDSTLMKRLPRIVFGMERLDMALLNLARQAPSYCASHEDEHEDSDDGESDGEGEHCTAASAGEAAADDGESCDGDLARLMGILNRDDDDDDGSTWSKSRMRGISTAGGHDQQSEVDEEEEEERLSMLVQVGRGRKRKRRLRSRNPVVDRWLELEDGSDAFADLEGYLVDDEYTF